MIVVFVKISFCNQILFIMKLKNIFIQYAFNNKMVLVIIFIYVIVILSIIQWGIPNEQHPFTYHMDEWHQLQAVRNTFKSFTPNAEGSAHGTIFHFFLSGIYLIPFYLLKIIDPFVIKSGLSSIPMQAKLFEILRLNTLLFGVMSLIVLNEIVKKYFKINPTIILVLFTCTPVWIYLSNYFKYDIALTFWILTAIFFLLRFGSNPSLKNYVYAGIACALALAVKISALPLLLVYIFSFFYFTTQKKRVYNHLLIGCFVFLIVFLIIGIPDVLFGKANYGDFLTSNLIAVSDVTNNFLLPYRPWWIYTFLVVMPINFGSVFFSIFLLSIIYWITITIKKVYIRNFFQIKNVVFILISFFIFLVSLWQLQIGANGNRLLVLLPFLALLGGAFLSRIQLYKISFIKRSVVIIVIACLLVIQFIESFAIINVKNNVDVRQSSSIWLVNNLKNGTTIGIENIPIYQLLPDIIVKEFYKKQRNSTIKTYFNYEVIDAATKRLPDIIVVTNREFEGTYLKKSLKKNLLQRMYHERYVLKKEFKPSLILYLLMKNELNMNASGLVPLTTISIYTKYNLQ